MNRWLRTCTIHALSQEIDPHLDAEMKNTDWCNIALNHQYNNNAEKCLIKLIAILMENEWSRILAKFARFLVKSIEIVNIWNFVIKSRILINVTRNLIDNQNLNHLFSTRIPFNSTKYFSPCRVIKNSFTLSCIHILRYLLWLKSDINNNQSKFF